MEPSDERDEDKARTRVVLRVRSRGGGGPAQETAPLSPPPAGLAIGAASPVAFYCNRDPHVDKVHGTLERTATHGVWVFVDHSAHGSTLNGRTRVHRDAVIVRSGDTLTVGATEIVIAIVPPEADETDKPSDKRQMLTNVNANSANAGRRWSMPKQSVPRIDTSFARPELHPPTIKRATSASAGGAAVAAAPEFINSPIPGNNWRRRRNSMATTTVRAPLMAKNDGLIAVKAIPSPPVAATAQPFAYPRGRTLVSPASTATSSASSSNTLYSPTIESDMISYHRQHHLYVRTDSPVDSKLRGLTPPSPPPSPPPASPIPLEYSSSPVSSSSPFLRRHHERQELEGKQPSAELASRLGAYTGGRPDGGPPKSRRDDLRIQVSKKMAAAAVEGRKDGADQCERQSRARHSPAADTLARIQQRNFEFTPPSSPVPQRDLERQQKSLLTILKHKYKEEQLLKQQQEEWMRRQFDGSTTRSGGNGTPPLSPIRSSQSVHPTTPTSNRAYPCGDGNEGEEEELSPLSTSDLRTLIPGRLPELMRTLSTGPNKHLPSPRVTAALLASRAARANVASLLSRRQHDDAVGEDDIQDGMLMRSADQEDGRSYSKGLGARPCTRSSSTSSSDSVSVSSSVTTEPARHRRVTRSLSMGSSIESDSSEAGSSSPSPADVSCSEDDLAVADFFIGYEDDTDEDDDPATFRFYSDEEFVSRSREDIAPLVGSATSKASVEDDASSSVSRSSSGSSTPPSSGLFAMDALRSPRRLTDNGHDSHNRGCRHHDYLLSKLRGPEIDQPNEDDVAASKNREVAARKTSSPVIASNNNNSHDAPHDEKAPLPPRGRRRRSAPPTPMTLGLPTSKLALSLAPTPPAIHQQEQNQCEDAVDQPELGDDDYKLDRASPPPPPPPSAEAPARDTGPRRPSFRRRSAFALA